MALAGNLRSQPLQSFVSITVICDSERHSQELSVHSIFLGYNFCVGMNLPIIGVVGRAGAGKNTVCDFAVELFAEHRLKAGHIACSDPLKHMCSEILNTALGIPPEAFYGSQDEKNAPLPKLQNRTIESDPNASYPRWTGREILQYVGTDCFHAIHPEVWIRHAITRCSRMLEREGYNAIFINGIRFKNEEEFIHASQGCVVRILRPEADAGKNQGFKNHPSEIEMSSIKADFVIDNGNRSLLELKQLVKDLLCDLHFLPSTLKQQG